MPEQDTVIGVIPARYGSTRFPGKPLARILGKPMIQHVYERASRAKRLSDVIVATDDRRIENAVREFGGRAVMTSTNHRTGTDRVAEVASKMDDAYYVNIQGDEPLIEPGHIDLVAGMLLAGETMATLVTRIRQDSDLSDPNVVKVILTDSAHAACFSRSVIPFPRKYLDKAIDVDVDSSAYYKHIGIYGYARSVLENLAAGGTCELEAIESLEQLRAIWLGIPIKVGIVDTISPCVDVPDDIQRVEKAIRKGA